MTTKKIAKKSAKKAAKTSAKKAARTSAKKAAAKARPVKGAVAKATPAKEVVTKVESSKKMATKAETSKKTATKAKLVKGSKPARLAKATKPEKPAKPAKATKPAKPAKATKPAKPAKPEPPDIGPPANPAEAALRTYALSLPHATEHFPWGHRVAKVNGKVFIIMGGSTGKLTASMKLPQSAAAALETGFCEPTGYGLGNSGWVTATFEGRDKVPLGMLRAWIRESYLAVAPKKIGAAMLAAEAEKS